ncbi:MAG TPA: glycosyltransferase family 4 protein [Rariglobus sp.]|jgi:glycosyltransferase involved in cell wall biosynthesis|nr:glycosyltransferase family 4 protein [Rariglobus sp.]
MKITIVMGFFLPVPPVSGGAAEKSWHRLAVEFNRRGHEITVVSRRWPGWPDRETLDGVTHLRLPGFSHTKKLWCNLALDFIWSLRVHFRLPAADIVVVNAVALPCWLGWLRPGAGRVVVMPGRMPKGQFRVYNHVARVMATSTSVLTAILAESPRWMSRTLVYGYPVNASAFAGPRSVASPTLTLGFIGRIHREKGLDLLVEALVRLAGRDLPPWRMLFCGPVDVARGGSGPEYRDQLATRLATVLPPDRLMFAPAEFDEAALARRYREIDLFCYPSLAAQGETFGVAVVEAMAAGAVPVVSNLACFRDFVRPGVNGEIFDHTQPDAATRLAAVLASLISDPVRRIALAEQASTDARPYDFPVYAERLLSDLQSLVSPLDHDRTSR